MADHGHDNHDIISILFSPVTIIFQTLAVLWDWAFVERKLKEKPMKLSVVLQEGRAPVEFDSDPPITWEVRWSILFPNDTNVENFKTFLKIVFFYFYLPYWAWINWDENGVQDPKQDEVQKQNLKIKALSLVLTLLSSMILSVVLIGSLLAVFPGLPFALVVFIGVGSGLSESQVFYRFVTERLETYQQATLDNLTQNPRKTALNFVLLLLAAAYALSWAFMIGHEELGAGLAGFGIGNASWLFPFVITSLCIIGFTYFLWIQQSVSQAYEGEEEENQKENFLTVLKRLFLREENESNVAYGLRLTKNLLVVATLIAMLAISQIAMTGLAGSGTLAILCYIGFVPLAVISMFMLSVRCFDQLNDLFDRVFQKNEEAPAPLSSKAEEPDDAWKTNPFFWCYRFLHYAIRFLALALHIGSTVALATRGEQRGSVDIPETVVKIASAVPEAGQDAPLIFFLEKNSPEPSPSPSSLALVPGPAEAAEEKEAVVPPSGHQPRAPSSPSSRSGTPYQSDEDEDEDENEDEVFKTPAARRSPAPGQ